MSQTDIIIFLEKELEKTKKELEHLNNKKIKEQLMFQYAKSKQDISLELGICLQSVTNNIVRLIKQEHIRVLKDEFDKRKTKYVINEKEVK